MNIDIHTLAVVLGVVNILQVVAFFLQYQANHTYEGLGWWLLLSVLTALGVVCMFLRIFVSPGLVLPSILVTNVLFVGGEIFLYIGIMRFLGTRENRGMIVSVFTVFFLSTVYVLFLDRHDQLRVIIFYAALAAFAFPTARGLFVHKTRQISASAGFLCLVLLAQGVYFVARAITALTIMPVVSVFTQSFTQTLTLLIPLVAGNLWSFGLIIMVNQRSNGEIGEAKQNLESIFNTSPDAILITRLEDSVFVLINEGFTVLTGLTRADVIGKTSLEIGLWRDPDGRRKFVAELEEKGFCDNLEFPMRRKDGSERAMLLSARVISLHDVPHIISVARDVTRIRLMDAALRESEEKYRLLVENSHDIIYRLSADGIFLSTSPAWTVFLGHAVDQVIGRSFQDFVHPDDHARCEAFIQTVIGTGQRQTGLEYRVRHLDGTWYWHMSSVVPFKDEAGTVIGFYGIASDITKRKQIEEERLQLISELQAALSEVKKLSGLLPICASCKKIRDDSGYWKQIEIYLLEHTEAQFSHGICPECMKKIYPEFCSKHNPDGGTGAK